MTTLNARRIKRTLHRLLNPVSPAKLREALSRVAGRTDVLFVHTSLSSCGRFTAGPHDVLAALGDVCSTLAFPAHTFSYPVSSGEAGPVFDAVSTPSQSGLLTEMFRNAPAVARSIQATHSMSARGPLAAELTADHYQAGTPCGARTPYSRLLERRASILMFGVTFHSYTLFHTAEDASGSAFAYEPDTIDRLRVLDEQRQVRECPSRRQTRNPRRFREAGDMLERLGLVKRQALGAGALLFVPDCAKVHDLLLDRLGKAPDFLYQNCQTPLS